MSETGWLIERRENNATEWWGLADALGSWMTDSARALRFARSEDAEAYAHSTGLDDAGFTTYITDHQWLDAPTITRPRPLSQSELEEMLREPETVDQICERISANLRAEIRSIFSQTDGPKHPTEAG